MHRFYLPPEQCAGPVLELSGREAHHAMHVLRVRPAERVQVLDGAGTQRLCQVRDQDRNVVRLEILETRAAPPLQRQITLLQALPKGRLLEEIIQKAVELGAARVVPLLSERVVPRLRPEDAAVRTAKWRQVAVEAIKQCGSPWLPQIEAPTTPREFLARKESCELALVGSLRANARHPREFFQAFQRAYSRPPNDVSVWIGPEGDFAPAELDLLEGAGVRPMTLGGRVLRTETAAVYCLAMLDYELMAPAQGSGR